MVWYGRAGSVASVDGTKPGPPERKGRNTTTEPRNVVSRSGSHSTAEGVWDHLPHFVSPSPLRQPCTYTASQSGPAHHGTPRRAPKGGPSSPGSPVPFSHPPPALHPLQRRKCIKCKMMHRNRKEYPFRNETGNKSPPSVPLSLTSPTQIFGVASNT